jgi:hypothetical protein
MLAACARRRLTGGMHTRARIRDVLKCAELDWFTALRGLAIRRLTSALATM